MDSVRRGAARLHLGHQPGNSSSQSETLERRRVRYLYILYRLIAARPNAGSGGRRRIDCLLCLAGWIVAAALSDHTRSCCGTKRRRSWRDGKRRSKMANDDTAGEGWFAALIQKRASATDRQRSTKWTKNRSALTVVVVYVQQNDNGCCGMMGGSYRTDIAVVRTKRIKNSSAPCTIDGVGAADALARAIALV